MSLRSQDGFDHPGFHDLVGNVLVTSNVLPNQSSTVQSSVDHQLGNA
jgi:hypothetical protein